MNSDRFVQAGAVVAGLGGTLSIGYFLLVLEVGGDFWTWPGWLGLALAAFGLLSVVVGLLIPERADETSSRQRQRAGKESRNYQAGRDINMRSIDHE